MDVQPSKPEDGLADSNRDESSTKQLSLATPSNTNEDLPGPHSEEDSIDYTTPEQEDRIVACCEDPDAEIYQTSRCTQHIVKIDDKVMVKCGLVGPDEFENQKYAHEHIDRNILWVPKPYHWFGRGQQGYLVMEYIEGEVYEDREDPKTIAKVAKAIDHMQTKTEPYIGPVDGGPVCGML